ncbi:TetR/AcrR family transcriptional regulator [Nonomuraea rosea]|uniref:TetR/AcrR family transcriptional regulator n=1 Tax=Nonomuraea rosea TaxID=638574 RepID=A0ABP6XT80_9ACTN
MEHAERLLDAAGDLFYRRGVQAVGMDEVRAASGVSLKRLYQCFPSKEALVVAYLARRDERWMSSLTRHAGAAAPQDRIAAVFAWLERWFGEDDFRGCGFVNAYAELGPSSEAVREVVRRHKQRLRDFLRELAANARDPDDLAGQLLVLVDGATVTAMLSPEDGAEAARAAGRAAALIRAAACPA